MYPRISHYQPYRSIWPQIETELQLLKTEAVNMWTLVNFPTSTRPLAYQFDRTWPGKGIEGKAGNGATQDRSRLRDIFALFCPVAIDLRFLWLY